MNIQPELIDNCIKRNRKAEYELYKLTYSYLMSICIRYTKNQDQAKETLNVGFLKILTNLHKYNPPVPFKAWIRRIMVNTLIDEYRKNKKLSDTIDYVEDYVESGSFYEINDAISKINADQILKLIDTLPQASKQVFNLYIIDGFSHKEIAEMLNISEGTSKWHLNFSRTKLKELLSDIVLPNKMAV